MDIFLKHVLWITVILFGAMRSALAEECESIEAAEVLKAEQLRLNSQMQNNLDIMSKLLDDQLVYVRNSAVVDAKNSYLNTVRVYGCVAILTGKGKYDVRIDQKPLNLVLRYHSIWQKSHGQVKLISWQATKVP